MAQDQEHSREAHSHVHGVVDVVVAVDRTTATVELHSPLWNVVGFEHAPSNQIEANEWVAAASRLNRPETIVRFPAAASCILASTELGPFTAAAGLPHSQDPDVHRSGDHGHDHDDHHEDAEYHDVVLGWSYDCGSPAAISSVTFALFESFPRVESADAVLFTDAGQASGIVTPGSNEIRLR